MEFYDIFVDRFQDLSKVKNPAANKAKGFRALKRKFFSEYDAVTLTMFYLKILHDIVSQNSSINFQKQPSCPRNICTGEGFTLERRGVFLPSHIDNNLSLHLFIEFEP